MRLHVEVPGSWGWSWETKRKTHHGGCLVFGDGLRKPGI